MTVIAFKSGVMAADTKAVDTNGQIFKTKKIVRLSNGTVVGSAGSADQRDILAILSKASLTKLPSRTKLMATKIEASNLWAFPTGEVFTVEVEFLSEEKGWKAEVFKVLEPQAAIGSGAAYALGAMLAGKSATDAVKITCKLDNGCGLPIESINLKEEI